MTTARKKLKLAVTVDIRDTMTGEVREYRDAVFYFSDHYGQLSLDTSIYLWQEGNYSCDCNRSQFFAEAGDEEDPDLPCGDGRFRVRIRRKGTDLVLYSEWELA